MDREPLDNDIRARILANDPSALELIWTEYSSDLLGYLVALHGSRHDAEDTLQDVFVTIAHKRAYVAATRYLKPYLFRLARNTALNRIKKETRGREKSRQASDWLEPEATQDTAGTERSNELAAALDSLPEKQRAVLVLKFFRNKTLREIGEMLDLSGNTVASCMRYGLEKLRICIREVPT
jgi:RNA polymerase sigma-70 factor (ECF subfamily)